MDCTDEPKLYSSQRSKERHSSLLGGTKYDGKITLVPQPCEHPNDPLVSIELTPDSEC